MDTESKLIVLKTVLTNICKDHFQKNDISAKLAYIVMRDICAEFQEMVLDEIVFASVNNNLPQEEGR